MKKTIITFAASLAVFSLAMTFSISIQPARAQTVNCPAGYTCTPITTQPVGCPVGFTCTPITTSSPSPTTTVTPVSCYTVPSNLYLGRSGSDVSALQTWLIANGYDVRNISLGLTSKGYYGNQTAGAVAKYLASSRYQNCAGNQTYQPTPTPIPSPSPISNTGPVSLTADTSSSNAVSGSYQVNLSFNGGTATLPISSWNLYVQCPSNMDVNTVPGASCNSSFQMGTNGQNYGNVSSKPFWFKNYSASSQTATLSLTGYNSANSVIGTYRATVQIPPTSSGQQTWSQVTVLSPNGGESFVAGQQMTITWKTTTGTFQFLPTSNVKIYLEQSNPGQSNIVKATFDNLPNSGSANVTIPSTIPAGSNYKAYVQVYAEAPAPTGSAQADDSDSTFTITAPATPTCPSGQTWSGSMCTVQVQSSSGQPYVKIASPNGGQQYTQGQTVQISFSTNSTSAQAPNGFNIWAYYGGNSTNVGSYASGVQNIAMSYTGSSPYSWTIPSSMATGNYVMYIVPATTVGISNTGLFAFGDSYFTINAGTTTTCPGGQTWNGSTCISSNQPVTVTVQSPSSGQTFTTGSTIPITWTSTGSSNLNAMVLLERFDDSANAGSPVTVKQVLTPNTGSYNLTVGSGDLNTLFPCPNGCTSTNGTASFDVRVIISTTGTPNAQSGRFTISGSATAQPTVTITAPNGGTFQAGTPITIQWTATGINSSNNSLGLAVYRTSTGSTQSLLSTTVSNTGSYSWTIPATAPSGSDYVVYMSTANTYKQSAPFQIIPQQIIPTVTVTSPNGGESWQVGSTHSITWTATNMGQNVGDIILSNYTPGSPDYMRQYPIYYGGSGINYSDSNGSGSYSWTIPSTIPAAQYKMSVESSDHSTFDASDSTFNIVAQ